MIKNISFKNPFISTIAITVLILLSPIIAYVLYVLFNVAIDPFMDNIDKNKFTTLETQVQNIYKSVKLSAASDENWRNSSACEDYKTSWMSNGVYICESYIAMKKNITSLEEVNELQNKYYPIFNNSSELKTKTELSLQHPNDFGKKFVVGAAEKNFIEVKSNVVCNYSLEVDQSEQNTKIGQSIFGSKIIDDKATVYIIFRCSEKARDSWYKQVHGIEMFKD